MKIEISINEKGWIDEVLISAANNREYGIAEHTFIRIINPLKFHWLKKIIKATKPKGEEL